MKRNLRERLRAETRPDHERVDQAFAGIDVATRRGFVAFAQAHEAGFSAMIQTSDPRSASDLRDMTNALRADLCILGETCLPTLPPDRALHPLACAYMIAGSRLGTAVMRKRWSKAPALRRANNYFGLTWDSAVWHALCGQLSAMDGTGQTADHVVRSTKSLFAMFAGLARRVDQQTRHHLHEAARP